MNFSKLDEIVRHENGLSRRLFLSYTAALSSVPWLGVSCSTQNYFENFKTNPFSLGVASGDPDHEGMVLWTKLAPEPLQLDYGMPLDSSAEVKWEMATDENFKNIVQSGTEIAHSGLGHTVHIETAGLRSDSWYWYRFHCGNYTSSVGRTRTMPLPSASPDKLKFAVTSCQHFEQGYFTAYEQMAADNVDLVFHFAIITHLKS